MTFTPDEIWQINERKLNLHLRESVGKKISGNIGEK